MQPVCPPLPELHRLGGNPQPAPEFRYRYVLLTAELLLGLANPPLQLLPPVVCALITSTAATVVVVGRRAQDLALAAGPGPYLAPADPRGVVLLALLAREPAGAALDPDLALEALPPEREAGPRVRGQVGRLPARPEVAVDDEALPGVQLLQVDDARGHAARRERRRRQAARLRVGDEARAPRRAEPAVELADRRLRVQVLAGQDPLGELLRLAVVFLAGWGDCILDGEPIDVISTGFVCAYNSWSWTATYRLVWNSPPQNVTPSSKEISDSSKA